MPGPAEIAQVGNRAGLPKQGVERLEIDKRGRVESGAFARSSGNVAVAVDPERDSIRIARVCREFLDLAIFPDDGLELKHLGGGARRVPHGGLSRSGNLAPAVDRLGRAVISSQRGQGSHHEVLPRKGQTGSTDGGKPKRFEAAKVFTIRIARGRSGLPYSLTPFVNSKRRTIVAANAKPSCPASPGVPMSSLCPWYQRTACTEVSVPAAAPLTRLLLVTKKGWPSTLPTAPRSVTV